MCDGYRDVTELNANELWELKDKLFWDIDSEEMTEWQRNIVLDAIDQDDIPDELIFDVFGHYSFVEEDFWCNIPDRN